MAKCPRCGSSNTSKTNLGLQIFQTTLSIGLSLINKNLGYGIGPENSKYRCNNCGHTWKAK